MLPFMDQSRYWGYEKDRRLFEMGVKIELVRAGVRPERGHRIVNDWFDLTESPYRFDFAIANGFWSRLTLNGIARCVSSVLGKLAPGGRFYVDVVRESRPVELRADRPRRRGDDLSRTWSRFTIRSTSWRDCAAPSARRSSEWTIAPTRAANR